MPDTEPHSKEVAEMGLMDPESCAGSQSPLGPAEGIKTQPPGSSPVV